MRGAKEQGERGIKGSEGVLTLLFIRYYLQASPLEQEIRFECLYSFSQKILFLKYALLPLFFSSFIHLFSFSYLL